MYYVPDQRPYLETKFSQLIAELKAMRENYKAEIGDCEQCEIDLDAGITSLEDALKAYNNGPDEHANSSAANWRDYQAEENATTGRED